MHRKNYGNQWVPNTRLCGVWIKITAMKKHFAASTAMPATLQGLASSCLTADDGKEIQLLIRFTICNQSRHAINPMMMGWIAIIMDTSGGSGRNTRGDFLQGAS